MKKLLPLCYLLILLPVVTFSQIAPTPHIISFFMVPCATNKACAQKFPHEKLGDIAGSHTKIARQIIKGHLVSPLVQGIYVAYLGYITYTDYNGQIMLPNKEAGDELTVVVTSQIYPVLIQENTVHHFEIPEEVEAQYYKYKLTHNQNTGKWFWNIEELNRPGSSRIPNHALIVLAKPKDIEINTGVFETTIGGPHFILPDMYVHTGIDTPFCVLKFLKVNRFFEPLAIEKKYYEKGYAQAAQP